MAQSDLRGGTSRRGSTNLSSEDDKLEFESYSPNDVTGPYH